MINDQEIYLSNSLKSEKYTIKITGDSTECTFIDSDNETCQIMSRSQNSIRSKLDSKKKAKLLKMQVLESILELKKCLEEINSAPTQNYEIANSKEVYDQISERITAKIQRLENIKSRNIDSFCMII